MKDIDRNTRTLIICFVVAVFSLIPLRFYEIGNKMGEFSSGSQVLGLSQAAEVVDLPSSQVTEESQIVLEYPYNKIEEEGAGCLSGEEVDSRVRELTEVLKADDLDEETVTVLIGEIENLENSACK